MAPKAIDNQTGAEIPGRGEWPASPQEPADVSKERLWIDGCFDFAHHGHAGAILQAKRLGRELVVGVHSDAEILKNKGPPVMTLQERVTAVEACRWADKAVPSAPYVTSIPWIDHYGCEYVVHGDDITSDSNGEDCYRFVKDAGRFLVVKRTPGISTTDLVGRMLLFTKSHFLRSLPAVLEGREGPGDDVERSVAAESMHRRLTDYATDSTGKQPHVEVWSWVPSAQEEGQETEDGEEEVVDPSEEELATSRFHFDKIVTGKEPLPGQRVVYVDGTFDLFSTGHIEFFKMVMEAEEKLAKEKGWYSSESMRQIEDKVGRSVPPVYLVVGIHDDGVANHTKGSNYPIMNIFERGLCVLQCKYVNAVLFGATFIPSKDYLDSLPYGRPDAVYHGPTAFTGIQVDPYADAQRLGIFREIGEHSYSQINASEIATRVLRNRAEFEARQKAKGFKGGVEHALQIREQEGERETGRHSGLEHSH